MARSPNPFSNRTLKNLIKRLMSTLDDGLGLIGEEAQQLIEEAARAALQAERRLAKTFGPVTARRLVRQTSSSFRKLTPAELELMGLRRRSERYVERTVRRPTAKSATLSKRQIRQKRLFEQTGRRQTLERAAERRKAGDLGYETRAAEEQARKQIRTRQTRRLRKKVDELTRVSDDQGRKYRPQRQMRDAYFELRERKLAGEFIEDGDWHVMVDMARTIEDPALKMLRQSPDVTGRD